MNRKILVVGAAVIDIVVEVEKLPKTGEDIYGRLIDSVVGGCGYNVQRILSKFNLDVDFLCPIGTGQYASFIKNDFADKEIALMVEDKRMDNGWNISFVEEDGERTFLSIPGIEVHWDDIWFEKVAFEEYDYIYISGYEMEGESGKVILRQLEKLEGNDKTKLIFDPSPRAAFLDKELLRDLYNLKPILHSNKEEVLALTGKNDLEFAMKAIYAATQTEVITTLGAEGAAFYNGDFFDIVPSKKVEVADTIGAGDSHTAAYTAGKALGFPCEKACKLANRVSEKIVSNATGNFESLAMEEILLHFEAKDGLEYEVVSLEL